MSENPLEAIERLEKLAAWHRINAEHAGADWVWEARLRAAEDLERRAAKIRGQLSSGSSAGSSIPRRRAAKQSAALSGAWGKPSSSNRRPIRRRAASSTPTIPAT